MLNPISSPFSSIVLKSSSSSGFDIELIDFDPQKNQFCQFERMEMEESVNSVFPTGAIIVRDTSDIITYIADKKIELIKVKLNNGESYEWFITSVTYVNNAASEMDQAFVAIYFTNKIFKESQEVSFYLERGNPAAPNEPRNWLFPIKYPFITTPTHITAVYGNKKVFTPALSIGEDDEGDSIQKVGCGVNLFIKNTQEPTNYVLFRPRIADSLRTEQFQTNIITYLSYIFTYAVNQDGSPYYLFWTDFSGCLNYKFFDLKTDLLSGQYSLAVPDTNPGQIQVYGVYDSPDTARLTTLMMPDGNEAEVFAKKIYVLVTNPAYSYNKKNYYYSRENPVYMEQRPFLTQGVTSSYFNLMSPFLSEHDNRTITTVTSYSLSSSPPTLFEVWDPKDQNLVALPDKGFFGYSHDIRQHKKTINTTDAFASFESIKSLVEATPAGLRDNPEFDQGTPILPFNDTDYMWQYPYDLTLTHPNLKLTEEEETDNNGEQGGGGEEGTPNLQNDDDDDDDDDEQSNTPPVTQEDFFESIAALINQGLSQEQASIPDSQIYDILKEVSFNKVMQAKYETQYDGTEYDSEKRKYMEQIEKENFVSNVLCCMGNELIPSEEWFFAIITGFIKDRRQIMKDNEPWITPLTDAWLYSWKRLEAGPVINALVGNTAAAENAEPYGIPPGGTHHAYYQTMFQGWNMSECYGSTGSPSAVAMTELEEGIGFEGLETWAININERLNKFSGSNSEDDTKGLTLALPDYLGPGFNARNVDVSRTFSYRPVGFTGQFYAGETMGSAAHIVQMKRISINKLRELGCAVPAPLLSDYSVYYFNVENVIDGAC